MAGNACRYRRRRSVASKASVSACRPTSASECPDRALSCGIAHAAQRDMVARFESMDIIPIARTHIGKSRHRPRQSFIGHGDIPCPGQFHIVGRARHDPHGNSGPFGDRRVVGEIVQPFGLRPFMGVEDGLEGKALRRLRREKSRALDRSDRPARHGWTASTCRIRRAPAARRCHLPQASITLSTSSASRKGRTASWISTMSALKSEEPAARATSRPGASARHAPPSCRAADCPRRRQAALHRLDEWR